MWFAFYLAVGVLCALLVGQHVYYGLSNGFSLRTLGQGCCSTALTHALPHSRTPVNVLKMAGVVCCAGGCISACAYWGDNPASYVRGFQSNADLISVGLALYFAIGFIVVAMAIQSTLFVWVRL